MTTLQSTLSEIKSRAEETNWSSFSFIRSLEDIPRLVKALDLAIEQRDQTGASWDDYTTHDAPAFNEALLQLLTGDK